MEKYEKADMKKKKIGLDFFFFLNWSLINVQLIVYVIGVPYSDSPILEVILNL